MARRVARAEAAVRCDQCGWPDREISPNLSSHDPGEFQRYMDREIADLTAELERRAAAGGEEAQRVLDDSVGRDP